MRKTVLFTILVTLLLITISCGKKGCIDERAANYDSAAESDDGSCDYVYGCDDFLANNYNPEAGINDGSCDYSIQKGEATLYFDVILLQEYSLEIKKLSNQEIVAATRLMGANGPPICGTNSNAVVTYSLPIGKYFYTARQGLWTSEEIFTVKKDECRLVDITP